MKPTAEPKVIIRHCAEYDVQAIRKIVREGMQELGLKPTGRTLVKPNLVAAGKMFPNAHNPAPRSARACCWRCATSPVTSLAELASASAAASPCPPGWRWSSRGGAT
jgi:hypothetical protein